MHTTETNAVVIGASIAGLAAALALAPRTGQVTIVERHARPAGVASIVPQGPFPHVLLAAGARALEELSPGFLEELRAAGAVGSPGARSCHWAAAGRVRRQFPDLGVDSPLCSRDLLETVLRRRVEADPRIEVRWGASVAGLVPEGPALAGVALEDGTRVRGSLVVDAGGRAARGVGWLKELGASVPPVEVVGVGIGYTAVDVEQRPGDLGGAEFAIVQNSAALARMGLAVPVENGRWRIALGAYFDQSPDPTPAAMREFAAGLADPVLAELLDRDWAGPARRHRFPDSRRHRWSTIDLPEGYLPLGDIVGSVNPIYGHGMSSAALQAVALGEMLDRHGVGKGLSRRFSAAAERIVAQPWSVAVGGDFVYPDTAGARPPLVGPLARHVERVLAGAAVDPVLNRAFSRVQGLLDPPSALVTPRILVRAWRYGRASGQPSSSANRASAASISGAAPST